MVKIPEMPIRQEKLLSSEFHMVMLRELEEHHDERSVEWSTIDPLQLIASAQLRIMRIRGDIQHAPQLTNPKQLVHAANELAIAWAILISRATGEDT